MKTFKIILLLVILLNKCLDHISKDRKLIISLTTNPQKINYLSEVVYSLLNQEIDSDLYHIIIVLSEKDFLNKQKDVPSFLYKIIEINKNVEILWIKNDIGIYKKFIPTLIKFPRNPILVINDDVIRPEGWLKMFIKDCNEHPNQIISGAIELYYDENLNIKNIYGYKSKYMNNFNHITNMIFNFALPGNGLGGILFPQNTFNNSLFLDKNLFLNLSKDNDELWQFCFIIMEDKIIRQSSIIYDYTEYLINSTKYDSFYKNNLKQKILKYEETSTLLFRQFPKFKQKLIERQHRILVSLTSYPKRFLLLPKVFESLKSQTLSPHKIVLSIFEGDLKNITLNLKNLLIKSGVKLETIKYNIKPHIKYFPTMVKYINYAIITVDDDVIYSNDTVYSLFKSYIKFPNLVSGRRVKKIKFFSNGELMPYNEWKIEYLSAPKPSFDLFATGIGGVLYPPNIFNLDIIDIKKIYLNLLTDDIYLKYLQIQKGIEVVWVQNENPDISSIPNNIVAETALHFNNVRTNNDICLQRFNILINDVKISKFCGEFPGLKSGKEIFLENIHNITYINKKASSFSIEAKSDCPINIKKKFHIFSYIGDFEARCSFNKNETNIKYKLNLIAFCEISKINFSFTNYLIFPYAKDDSIENPTGIVIKSQKISLKMVFRQAYYIKNSNKKLTFNIELIILDNQILINVINLIIKINNIISSSICKLNDSNRSIEMGLIIGVFLCEIESPYLYDLNNTNATFINSDYITGLNNKIIKKNRKNGNLPVQFTITKIINNNKMKKSFILKGVTSSDIIENINFTLFLTFQNKQANCTIFNTSKLIQGLIICNTSEKFWPIISIESQIILKNDIEILLIRGQENIVTEKINSAKLTEYIILDSKNIYFEDKNNTFIINEIFLCLLLNSFLLGVKFSYIFTKFYYNHANIKN